MSIIRVSVIRVSIGELLWGQSNAGSCYGVRAMQRDAMGGECEEGGDSGGDLWDGTASQGWRGACRECNECAVSVCAMSVQ